MNFLQSNQDDTNELAITTQTSENKGNIFPVLDGLHKISEHLPFQILQVQGMMFSGISLVLVKSPFLNR